MDTGISVLFVSASAADEKVLSTLLAGDEAGVGVRLRTAATAQAFYDALYSEESYQVIVLDDQQPWSDWQSVTTACSKSRPNALQVLLTDSGQPERQVAALGAGIAAVYPRNSAGLIALAKLVSRLAAQGQSFSLRQDPQASEADAEADEQEDREKLVYAVSHDLQDPLQLARRYAEILNEDFESELGDSGSKVLEHLQFNLGRTQDMLDELLDYSRLENAPPDRRPVDLNELLDEVTALYKLTLDEIGGSITRQQSLPTLVVDRRQFQRLFQNLIGNAIKFRSDKAFADHGAQPAGAQRVADRGKRQRNRYRGRGCQADIRHVRAGRQFRGSTRQRDGAGDMQADCSEPRGQDLGAFVPGQRQRLHLLRDAAR